MFEGLVLGLRLLSGGEVPTKGFSMSR